MNESNTINVIYVEPLKPPRMIELEENLEAMQQAVGGDIEEYMPYEDEVALVCNREGKMNNLPLNRAITDDEGHVMDIIAGPFFIAYAPCDSEKFLSMPEDLKEKYMKKFKTPEKFVAIDHRITAIPYAPHKDEMER